MRQSLFVGTFSIHSFRHLCPEQGFLCKTGTYFAPQEHKRILEGYVDGCGQQQILFSCVLVPLDHLLGPTPHNAKQGGVFVLGIFVLCQREGGKNRRISKYLPLRCIMEDHWEDPLNLQQQRKLGDKKNIKSTKCRERDSYHGTEYFRVWYIGEKIPGMEGKTLVSSFVHFSLLRVLCTIGFDMLAFASYTNYVWCRKSELLNQPFSVSVVGRV